MTKRRETRCANRQQQIHCLGGKEVPLFWYLKPWNKWHLYRGKVALIGGIGGTYTVEYSATGRNQRMMFFPVYFFTIWKAASVKY
jgi:hypothetical protein